MPVVTKVQKDNVLYDFSAQGLVEAVTAAAQYAANANAALVAMQQIIATYESSKADAVHMHQATDIYDLGDAVQICKNAAKLAEVFLGEIDTFDAEEAYPANTLVLHDIGTVAEPDVRCWRALEPHVAGDAWDPDAWEQVSLMSILASILDVSYEIITVCLTSSDSELDLTNRQVTLQVIGGSTMTQNTDANGECGFVIEKGKRYTISVPTISTFVTPATRTFKAVQNTRDVIFEYIPEASGNELLSIGAALKTYGMSSEDIATLRASLVGQTVQVAITGGATTNLQYDSNLTCSMTIPYGSEYTVRLPIVTNMYCKNTVQTFTAGAPIRSISPVYYYLQDDFYVIDSNGTHYTFEDIQNGDLADVNDALLLHITNSTLAANNADFYLPLQMLRVARPTGAWAGSNIEFPGVPIGNSTSVLRQWPNPTTGNTGDWDMHYNTAKIRSVGAGFEPAVSTPAANTAHNTVITIDNQPLNGCLGTILQWEQLIAMNSQVSAWLLELFGIGSPLASGSYWSSSQYSATYAWRLHNGQLLDYSKTYSLQVLPFFDFR